MNCTAWNSGAGQQAQRDRLAEDLGGEAAPAEGRRTGVMEGAPREAGGISQGPGRQGQPGAGDGLGAGGAAHLVIHDAQGWPVGGQPQHGAHEVGPLLAEHPADAQQQVRAIGGPQGLLAGQLAGAVDAFSV